MAIAAAAVGLGAIATVFLLSSQRQDAALSADDAAWDVVGPPCPALAAADYQALAISHPQPFAFESLKGERAHGEVSCSETSLDHGRRVAAYPVCSLRAPLAVRLTTPTGEVYFKPGAGEPATISTPGGRVRCVMGGNLGAG